MSLTSRTPKTPKTEIWINTTASTSSASPLYFTLSGTVEQVDKLRRDAIANQEFLKIGDELVNPAFIVRIKPASTFH